MQSVITRCPICGKEVKEKVESFPFCSWQCKWVDLSYWLEEEYRIPDSLEKEEDEND